MHNFKWKKSILFLILCVVITLGLNYALIPWGTVKANLSYLKNKNTYDTIFLGTSHGQYGIDPAIIDQAANTSSLNLCMADAYPDDMYYILKLALETQQPKTVVYELDPSYWINEQRSGSTQIFFYQEFPLGKAKAECFFGKIMDLDFRSTLAPWSYYRNQYGEIRKNIALKQSAAHQVFNIVQVPNGHYGGRGFLYRNRIPGEDKGSFNQTSFQRDSIKEKAVESFQRMVTLCKEKGITLVVITTPIPEETLANTAASYQEAQEYFSQLMNNYGIPYINFNYEHSDTLDRSMTGYWDYDGHMDGIQAETFSQLLGENLVDLIQ